MSDATPTPTVVSPPPTAAPEVPQEQATPAAGFTFAQMLATLPETIRLHLLSSEFSGKLVAIAKQFKLTQPEQDLVLRTVLEVFFEDLTIAEFPDELWNRLNWDAADEDRARDMTIQILGRVFLPAQAFVGDVVTVLSEFDVDAKTFPQEQLELRQVTYSDAAKTIASSFSDLTRGDEQQRQRLEHIIESRLREARNDVETSEQLQRPSKLGGLELAKADADKVLNVLSEETRLTKFVEAYEAPASAAPGAKRYTAEDVRRVYAGIEEERKQLADLRAKIAQGGENPENALTALRTSLQPPDKPLPEPLEVVAGLLFWAEKGDVVDDLGAEDRLGGLVVDYLESKGRGSEVEDFRSRPAAPKYVNILLQMLLSGNASLNEADSARFGLRAANILRRRGLTEYAGVAAFDAAAGAFKWQIPEQI